MAGKIHSALSCISQIGAKHPGVLVALEIDRYNALLFDRGLVLRKGRYFLPESGRSECKKYGRENR